MELDRFNSFLKDMEDLDAVDNFLNVRWTRTRQVKSCVVAKTRLRKRRFNPLDDLTEQQFRLKYRYSKKNMRRIIELVRDDLEVDNEAEMRANQVPVELQIMAAIRHWGMSEHLLSTAATHNVTSRTLTKICRRVAAALATKSSRYIRMPATLAEKERVTNAFLSLARMPQVIGAVAHSSVRLGRNANETDTNAKPTDSKGQRLHIQIVSDATYKIRDLDCKLRSNLGRATNCAAEMFAQSRIKERFEQNEFRGRILLGDRQLSCTSFLFTPVQFPATPEELSFTRAHATTYSPVATCLKFWKRRFGILDSEVCAPYGTAKHTVVALALLHNMAIDWDDPTLECDSNGVTNGSEHTVNGFLTSTYRNVDTHARLEFIKNNF